ncbi:MAG: ribokinase [Anaerolineae bacterium]
MSARIVVLGSFNADLVSYMARMPQRGETVMGDRFITGPGGKGSNQAVAAARLGAHVTFIARVGQDTLAEIGLNLWRAEGIDTSHISRDPNESTGVASIFVDHSGHNVIVVTLGANGQLRPAHVDDAEQAIAQADVLLTQLESPLETVAYALKVARSHGVRTIFNPAPARPLDASVLQYVDILTPNEHELSLVTGEAETAAATKKVFANGVQTLIVTFGKQGAGWQDASGAGALVPAYTVDAVDTVGAGDAFNGALAVGLAEGKTLEGAIRFANAAAAVSVTRPGAAASMGRRDEVEALIAAQP